MRLTLNEALSEFHLLLKTQGISAPLALDGVEIKARPSHQKASLASLSGLGKWLQNCGICLFLYELKRSIECGPHKISSAANSSGCSMWSS